MDANLRRALYKTIEDEATIANPIAKLISFTGDYAVILHIEVGTYKFSVSTGSDLKYSVDLIDFNGGTDRFFIETQATVVYLKRTDSAGTTPINIGAITVRKEIKYGVINNPTITPDEPITPSWAVEVKSVNTTQLESLKVDGNIDLEGNLTVNSNTTLGDNAADTHTITGVITASELINANGGIAVDITKFTVEDATGNTAIDGTLNVNGQTDLDVVLISETLDVTGISTFTGNINATGGIDVDDVFAVDNIGNLITTGAVKFDGTVDINNDTTIDATNLDITVTTTDIIGSVNLTGVLNIGGSLDVDNLRLNLNTLSSHTLGVIIAPLINNDLDLNPSGTGIARINTDQIVTLTADQDMTGKTYEGLEITDTTGTFTLTNLKTLTVTNNITLSTDDIAAILKISDANKELAGLGTLLTFGGNLTTSGAFTTEIIVGENTTVTLPATGTLYGTEADSITSAQLLSSVSDETGTGDLVFSTTPTLITPILGVATATSINKVSFTTPGTGSTLTIDDGKTLTVSDDTTFANGTITLANANVLTLGESLDTANVFTIAGETGSSPVTPSDTVTITGGTLLTSSEEAQNVTIDHDSVTRAADGTDTAITPDAGANFDVVNSMTFTTEGHINQLNTKNITLPTYDILTADNATAGTIDVKLNASGTGTDDLISIKGLDHITVTQSSDVISIDHDDVTREDTALGTAEQLTDNGTFIVIDSVSTDAQGHLNNIDTRVITLPEYTLDSVTDNGATTTNDITVGDIAVNGGNITSTQSPLNISSTDAVNIGTLGSLTTVKGDLKVDGTTFTIDSNTVNIGDNIISLNSDVIDNTSNSDGGIEVKRLDTDNLTRIDAQILWNETSDYWTAGVIGSLSEIATQSKKLSFFTAGTTSLELKGLITDETGSGSLVFADNPALGVITATSINGLSIATTTSTLTLAGNLTTAGAFATQLTATAATALTLPTSGTLMSKDINLDVDNIRHIDMTGDLTVNKLETTTSYNNDVKIYSSPALVDQDQYFDEGLDRLYTYTMAGTSWAFVDFSGKLIEPVDPILNEQWFDKTNNRLYTCTDGTLNTWDLGVELSTIALPYQTLYAPKLVIQGENFEVSGTTVYDNIRLKGAGTPLEIGVLGDIKTSITADGDIYTAGTLTVDGSITSTGSLDISGATFSLDSTDTSNITMTASNVADKTLSIIALNSLSGDGIIQLTADLVNVTGALTVSGTITGNVTGALDGNAATATLAAEASKVTNILSAGAGISMSNYDGSAATTVSTPYATKDDRGSIRMDVTGDTIWLWNE